MAELYYSAFVLIVTANDKKRKQVRICMTDLDYKLLMHLLLTCLITVWLILSLLDLLVD